MEDDIPALSHSSLRFMTPDLPPRSVLPTYSSSTVVVIVAVPNGRLVVFEERCQQDRRTLQSRAEAWLLHSVSDTQLASKRMRQLLAMESAVKAAENLAAECHNKRTRTACVTQASAARHNEHTRWTAGRAAMADLCHTGERGASQ